MGNAAIAGIEHENQVAEQKQLQASIEKLQATQSAELGASTDAFEAQTGQMASDYINARAQTTLDQEYAGTEQALESQLAAMPDPSLAASIAAINADNQRIAAMQASQGYDAYGTGIQWLSAGEQEEAFNAFPNATYGTNADAGSSTDVVGDYINMMNQAEHYGQAALSGSYDGIRAIPGEIDGAVASAWTGVKNLASAAKFDAVSLWDNGIGTDLNQLQDGLTQLPGAIQALPGDVQRWGIGMGVKLAQDGEQLLNYLHNTPGTQITYDTAYGITSNAPWIALGAATDGFGDVASVDGAISVTEGVGARGVVDIEALNHATALDFYMNQAGFSEERALEHMMGIDFSQPVTVTQLDSNTILQQYVGKNGQGNYFAPVGGTPLESGLVVTDQALVLLQNERSVMALQSITKQDFLYPPGEIVPGSGAGGGTQYFIPNKTVFKPIGGN